MSKALVLEPRKGDRKLIADVLKKEGLEVRVYDRAPDLVDDVSASAADIVLMDIHMPSLDGEKILGEIREKAPEVPILLLTSRHATKNEKANLGGYACVTKPIDRARLSLGIRTLINQIRQRRKAFPSNALTEHMLPELHDPSSGRLDAKLTADFLSIPLSAFSTTLQRSVAALHKNPSAASLQEHLVPIARSVAILYRLLGSKENVRAWMNSPHPDLGNRTPLSFILEGRAEAVVDMLEAALAGQPS